MTGVSMSEAARPQNDRVFVVHGRNLAARDAMFTFLRTIGLKPIEWDQAVAMTGEGSPYIGDVLDVAFDKGGAIVVLLTPDDVAYLRTEYANDDTDPELTPAGQARPNVLFEAGMAMGRNPKRTILVEMGDLRPFSNVGGRHAVRMTDTTTARKSLAQRLDTAGLPVDLTGSDWLSAGDFTPPPKPGNGAPLGKRIPSSDRHGAHVDGRYYNSGRSASFDSVKVTNNGGVDILKADLVIPEELSRDVQMMEAPPVSRLPVGKTFTRKVWTTGKTFGGGSVNLDQFELLVVGELEDGSTFSQPIFLDTVA